MATNFVNGKYDYLSHLLRGILDVLSRFLCDIFDILSFCLLSHSMFCRFPITLHLIFCLFDVLTFRCFVFRCLVMNLFQSYIVGRDWNKEFASLLYLNISSSGETTKHVSISLGHDPRYEMAQLIPSDKRPCITYLCPSL